MPLVSESMSWATNKEEFKAFLGLDGSTAEDLLSQLNLEAAIQKADEYLERDFVPYRVRFLVGGAIAGGEVYTLSVTLPDSTTAVTATYTAGSGDSLTRVAYYLRDQLAISLALEDVSVMGSGPAVEVVLDDPLLALEYAGSVSGGTGTLTTTAFYETIPADVKRGVYEYGKALREVHKRAAGVKAVKTAAQAESYGDRMGEEVAFRAAKSWWAPYKAHPLLDGKN